MVFLIILIISFISILYIFKNNITKLSNERKSIYKIQNTTFIFIVLFFFTLSSLIYNYIGNPFINIKELYSQRDRLKETEAQKNKNFAKNLQKFNELNIALKREPNNIQILLKLAEVASKVNKIEAEIASLTKLNSINSSPKIKSLLAQAIVRKANGQVTTKAKKIIDEILIENPLEPGANFLNGLRQSQIGNEDEALKIWVKLYNSTIKNDTWKKNLEKNIKSAAKNIGLSQKEINIQLKNNKNINDDAATNILNLSEKEQKIRIYGMVEQLANRLNKEKDDFEGWIRLFNSYKYLQENDKALSALRTAIEIKPSIILKQTLLKELLPPQGKPKFTLETDKLIDDILIKEPNNIDALFFKGLKAFNKRENNTAKLYWDKLIATLPPNSKISLELINKLKTLEK